MSNVWKLKRERHERPEARGDAWVYEVTKEENFWGILVDEEICYKTLFQPKNESHDELDEFIIPLEGRYWVKIGDWSRTLSPGEMAIIPRGIEHDSGVATNLVGTHFLVLLFHKSHNILSKSDAGGVVLPKGTLSWLKGAFYFLKRESSNLSLLPLLILPEFLSRAVLCEKLESDNNHPDPIVAKVIKLLEQPSSLNLGSLAEQVNLSPTHLQKRFSKAMGTSPLQYANTWKLDAIADELKNQTGLSILELAIAYGFNDLKHFRTLFKRRFGLPPSAYAKNPPS